MSPHKTKTGAALYEAMLIAERAWENRLLGLGIQRYSHAGTGVNNPDLRTLYLAKHDASRAYFDYLAEMRGAA